MSRGERASSEAIKPVLISSILVPLIGIHVHRVMSDPRVSCGLKLFDWGGFVTDRGADIMCKVQPIKGYLKYTNY